jgi:hypothetical protein
MFKFQILYDLCGQLERQQGGPSPGEEVHCLDGSCCWELWWQVAEERGRQGQGYWEQSVVAYTCNPTYAGGDGRRIMAQCWSRLKM